MSSLQVPALTRLFKPYFHIFVLLMRFFCFLQWFATPVLLSLHMNQNLPKIKRSWNTVLLQEHKQHAPDQPPSQYVTQSTAFNLDYTTTSIFSPYVWKNTTKVEPKAWVTRVQTKCSDQPLSHLVPSLAAFWDIAPTLFFPPYGANTITENQNKRLNNNEG